MWRCLRWARPKLVRSTYETPEQIIKDELESLGTTEAFFAGIFFLFLYSSTIYHLFYMGIQRYVAINWPMRYRSQSTKSIRVQLSFIWLFSLVSGTLSGLQLSFHGLFCYLCYVCYYKIDTSNISKDIQGGYKPVLRLAPIVDGYCVLCWACSVFILIRYGFSNNDIRTPSFGWCLRFFKKGPFSRQLRDISHLLFRAISKNQTARIWKPFRF